MFNFRTFHQIVFNAFLLMLFLRYTTQSELEQKYMRVVDNYNSAFEDTGRFNVIFRSNIPEDKNLVFEYDKLVKYMINVAKSEKRLRIEKENIYILDYSLLHLDDPRREEEEKFWSKNPSKGKLMGWPVMGENKNPEDYSINKIISMSKDLSWMRDDIENWIDEIHSAATSFRNDSNVMVLIHCHYGKDRTGEISGAYQLKYSGKTWQEVIATNYQMYSKSITYENQRALTWFCYHLQYHRNYSHLQCTNENLSKQNEIVPSLLGWDVEDDDHSNSWKIAFFSVLGSSLFALFAVFIVLIVVVLIVKWSVLKGFMRGKIASVRPKFMKIRNSSNVLHPSDDISSAIENTLDTDASV